jgi:phosphatidate cytidylyltransferase
MLKQRIITAIVLLAILLPALFWPSPVPFAAVTLVLIAAGAWEWGRLNGLGQGGSVLAAITCLSLCAASWYAGLLGRPLSVLWAIGGGLWVLAGAWLLRGGVAGWPKIAKPVRLVGGVLVLWLAWLAVAQARVIGINFLLSVLVLVWVADIAAYAAGRSFGLKFTKKKLAPAISPGKSWEGVWGGMAGVLVLAVAWTLADGGLQAQVPSLYSRMAARGWWLLLIAAVFLAAMSVVGDLAESLIKRSAGVKDSSNLLPGHGGVLDRVDALLPTLPLAMMLATLAPS